MAVKYSCWLRLMASMPLLRSVEVMLHIARTWRENGKINGRRTAAPALMAYMGPMAHMATSCVYRGR